MGEIRVKVKLTNAADEGLFRRGKLAADATRTYEAEGMVDTGAVRSVIPVHVQEKLGLESRGHRIAEYADGPGGRLRYYEAPDVSRRQG